MAYRKLAAADAFWRPSNQMGVENTDLGRQLEAEKLGARLWQLKPGQASTRHRHVEQEELYLLLEGDGRMRIDGDLLTLEPLDAVLVEPESVRQIFNDTGARPALVRRRRADRRGEHAGDVRGEARSASTRTGRRRFRRS